MMLSANKNDGQISNKQLFLLFFPLLAIIVFWFSHWQTQVIYGDDLGIYQYYLTKSDAYIIAESQKYRPINTWLIKLLIATLGKHVSLYYYFNAAMQAICALLFIKIANLFLRNIFFSFLFGVLVAVSRFNFYNLTQLYNGGAMEVLALIWFLAGLYYWLKATYATSNTQQQNLKYYLAAILFANASIYTHERYIVFFPFLLLALFIPALSRLKLGHRLLVGVLIVASVAINYFIKKEVYHIAFFMGTGNTHIQFSFATAFGYLCDALLDLFQFNAGPEYLSGYPYMWLSGPYKLPPIIATSFIGLAVLIYVQAARKQSSHYTGPRYSGLIILSLLALLLLTLAPAVSTIRLEQRWLQAAFALQLVILAACLGWVSYNKIFSGTAMCLFITVFLYSERHYLDDGARNIYISNSAHKATVYKQAVDRAVIKPMAKELLILDTTSDANSQNELIWVLQGGQFFGFYGLGEKTIKHIDLNTYEHIMIKPQELPVSTQIIGQLGDSVYNIYPL